jgi:protein-S-isoprenylcysteine O-methyltransferase Ste14
MQTAMLLTISACLGFFILISADFALLRGKKGLSAALQPTGYLFVAVSIAGILLLAPSGVTLSTQTVSADRHATLGNSMPSSTTVSVLVSDIDAPIFTHPSVFFIPFCILCIVIFGSLLVWSVFLEIPVARKRLGLPPDAAFSGGTYTLCRHPGFWWLAFFLLPLGLARNYSGHFYTISLIILLNLLLTFLQDHYIFPKVFRGYDEYKVKVPFLLPKL